MIGPAVALSQFDSGYYGPTNACNDNFWTVMDAVESAGGEYGGGSV